MIEHPAKLEVALIQSGVPPEVDTSVYANIIVYRFSLISTFGQ